MIFRENTEDIYAGIEWEAESDGGEEVHRVPAATRWASRRSASRRPRGIGIKPVSREGTERLVRKAIQYAIDNERKSA